MWTQTGAHTHTQLGCSQINEAALLGPNRLDVINIVIVIIAIYPWYITHSLAHTHTLQNLYLILGARPAVTFLICLSPNTSPPLFLSYSPAPASPFATFFSFYFHLYFLLSIFFPFRIQTTCSVLPPSSFPLRSFHFPTVFFLSYAASFSSKDVRAQSAPLHSAWLIGDNH